MKQLFYWLAGIGFGGAIFLNVLIATSYSHNTGALNLLSVLGIVQVLAVLVGIYLLGKWAASKMARRDESGNAPFLKTPEVKSLEPTLSTKWTALSEFDGEIRTAVQTLRPHGSKWETKLAEAFFALQEDRRYLQGIVDRLVEQAKAERAEIWKRDFRYTANGEPCTEESIQVLRESKSAGTSWPWKARAFLPCNSMASRISIPIPTSSGLEILYANVLTLYENEQRQPEYVLNLPCFTPRMYPRDTRSSISRSKNSFAINSTFTASRASPPQAAMA
ncbi:hypothetical protein IVA80_08370 [Bradyrhizobium sp. 139]|uniref:hypothetical protein n=1 Tax=Bradyrhizobium sp. 139 TaxID=2782616 RepID=UPI0031FF42C9|nr:hypothetical protein [Bradyrhizobium sp. 139]